MAAVNTESAENMEYMRRLLKETQPRVFRGTGIGCGPGETGAGVTDMLRAISATKARSAG
jgi:hypothetical protein